MKRLGPELKMPAKLKPEMKVPPFLSDFYYDLRERRLLPVLALIIVGIIAVPFLLGNSESPELEVRAPLPAGGAATSAADAASLTVVQAKPGLRDYHKRLAGRKPTDPFKQRFTGPVLKDARLQGELSSTTSSSSTTSTSTSTSTTGTSTITSSESGGASPGGPTHAGPPAKSGSPSTQQGKLTIFTFAISVKTTKIKPSDGGKSKPEETTKQGVKPPAALPGKKEQVVTYIGISPKTKKPLFLVSDEVKSVFGEVHCVSGSGSCQLVEMEPGFPVTFVYGENAVRYKVNVLKIEPVTSGHF